jgi:fatty acid desaturase
MQAPGSEETSRGRILHAAFGAPSLAGTRLRTAQLRAAFIRLCHAGTANYTMTTQIQGANARQLCAPFARPSLTRALWQLSNTLLPFALLWWLMAWSHQTNWDQGWAFLLALPTAGLYVRLFIIQHDCGHGSYFASRRANQWVGACLGLITLFPFGYWKKTHAVHHSTSGNLDRRGFGDVHTLTVNEYRKLSVWGRFLYRVYRSMPLLLVLGPTYQLVIKHRLPIGLPLSWKKEWASVLLNDLILLIVGGVCVMLFDWRTIVWVQIPVVLIAGAMGVWLFYPHTGATRKIGITTRPRSQAALTTICRVFCIGSPAISATTTSIIWRRRSRITV